MFILINSVVNATRDAEVELSPHLLLNWQEASDFLQWYDEPGYEYLIDRGTRLEPITIHPADRSNGDVSPDPQFDHRLTTEALYQLTSIQAKLLAGGATSVRGGEIGRDLDMLKTQAIGIYPQTKDIQTIFPPRLSKTERPVVPNGSHLHKYGIAVPPARSYMRLICQNKLRRVRDCATRYFDKLCDEIGKKRSEIRGYREDIPGYYDNYHQYPSQDHGPQNCISIPFSLVVKGKDSRDSNRLYYFLNLVERGDRRGPGARLSVSSCSRIDGKIHWDAHSILLRGSPGFVYHMKDHTPVFGHDSEKYSCVLIDIIVGATVWMSIRGQFNVSANHLDPNCQEFSNLMFKVAGWISPDVLGAGMALGQAQEKWDEYLASQNYSRKD